MHTVRVPIGISNRHIHLSQQDADKLFGKEYEFKILKNLSQPGQYACEETVTLIGKKHDIEHVRVLGPWRKQTQVEISMGDARTLGVDVPIKISGNLKGSAGLQIKGPAGSVYLSEGVIVAKRHLHITQSDADEYGLRQGQKIKIKIPGDRGLIFENVSVRVKDNFAMDFHIDIDEANAAGIKTGDWGELLVD